MHIIALAFTNIVAALVMIFVLLLMLTAIVNLFIRVPYVPSKMRVVEQMIKVAKIKNGEKVYDLGCGDGRLLLEAEKKAKIKAEGYEAAPIPYLLATLKKWLNKSKIDLHFKNFFKTSLNDADVVFCYLGPETMTQLCSKLKKECKKGTRVISNTFQMQGATPTKVWPRDEKTKMPSIYLYRI